MYCTAQEVFDAGQLDSSVVSQAIVEELIKSAEREIDRETFTTYWAVTHDAMTASAATDNTISVATTPFTSSLVGQYVWVYSGTGINQIRKIVSNTTSQITVDSNWGTNPVATDKFRVIYTATDPLVAEDVDGNGLDHFYLPEYPIININSLAISGTSISSSNLYIYRGIGKIQLKQSAERKYFSDIFPQEVSLNYYYGVYPMPYEVKRFVVVTAAMKMLAAQMGGTYDDASMVTLPEGSVTVGQAYINIKGTWEVLRMEREQLMPLLIKYPKFC